MILILAILAIIIGYFIGSVSPAYFLGRLIKGKGFDIRKHGSKNAGAMNAFYVLGKRAGVITLIFDFAKGALAMLIAYFMIFGFKFSYLNFNNISLIVMCLSGFAAMLGHDFPFYLKFKGGKGGAAAGGIIITLLALLWNQEISLGISWLTWMPFLILIFLGLSVIVITKSGNLAGFIFYPLGIIWILISKFSLFSIAISFFLFY